MQSIKLFLSVLNLRWISLFREIKNSKLLTFVQLRHCELKELSQRQSASLALQAKVGFSSSGSHLSTI